MDDRAHLEQLEAVRPGSDDLAQPEFAEAARALRADPDLAEEFEKRQALDRQVVAALHDVPLPAGLAARLIERLAASEEDQTTSLPPRQAPQRRNGISRRGLLAMCGATLAGVLLAVVAWTGSEDVLEPLRVPAVERAAGQLLRGKLQPVPFSGEFQPTYPPGRWRRLRFTSGPLGLFPSESGHRAVAWRFRYGQLRGVLVSVPRAAIAEAPETQYGYVGGSTVAWTKGEFVYLCHVTGRIDDLLRRLHGQRLA